MIKLLFFAIWFWVIVTTVGAVEITSSAFNNGELIPSKYACNEENGENISPPLAWSGFPVNTKSLVLIVEDPDAPGGVVDHWIVFNIPTETTGFVENIGDYPEGAAGGQNWAGNDSYTGPCPPDKEHRYFFKIYALDSKLALKAGVTKVEVLKAMQGHILEENELMGRYDKPRNKELSPKK